jgi:hypothetical protein
MPTDPRDIGWTVPTTDTDGYSDLIQFNGSHIQTLDFAAMEATVTEIWFEKSPDDDTDNCQEVYLDDCKGTTDRLKITVPTGKAATGFSVVVPPSYFGGWNWARIQLTDGSDGVQQSSAAVAGGIGCRDYR